MINIVEQPYNQLFVPFEGIGLYRFRMEQLQGIDLTADIPTNTNLAGHIESEYKINDQKTQQLIDLLVTPVVAHYDHFSLQHKKISKMFIGDLPPPSLNDNIWVNRQKKYEFNPFHTHSGVYSFVLWYDIPYTPEEEAAASPFNGYNPRYDNVNVSGTFEAIRKDEKFRLADGKDWNGTLAIFPSNLIHGVYPFYSTDKERITISGNYLYK